MNFHSNSKPGNRTDGDENGVWQNVAGGCDDGLCETTAQAGFEETSLALSGAVEDARRIENLGLAEVVRAWPKLQEDIRKAILVMARYQK